MSDFSARRTDQGKEAFPKTLKYSTFKQRHPCYNADRWAVLRALYEGGEKIDCDTKEGAAMLRKLLPKHVGEEDDVYEMRLKFALYIPYAGQICDFILAAMASDPITVSAKPEFDKWYTDFYDNTAAEDAAKQPFEEFLRCQLMTALICQRAWALVDLPKVFDSDNKPANLAEQEAAGALDAYLVAVEPENVIDWEESDDGCLQFAILYKRTQARTGLTGNRDRVREEFTYFTTSQWARYAIEWDSSKNPDGPKDDDECAIDDEGDHTFGRVPLVPLDLPAGLHAMGKVKQLAQSHFNKRSALDWGEYRSAFQFLAVNLGPEDPQQAVTGDANRATNQRIGHGRVWVGGEKDRIGYVGPDAGPFQVIMADLNLLRDEMHRVLHSMALSVDNSGAALQRSGDSKSQDQVATTIVLKKLGNVLRDYAVRLYDLVAVAHGDDDKYKIDASGGDEYDAMSLHGFLEEMATLSEIGIPSQTWKKRYFYKAARLSLGGAATDGDLKAIKGELDENITAESVAPPMVTDPLGTQALLDGADGGEGADSEPGATVKAPKPPKVKAAKAPKTKAAKAPTAKAATGKGA